MAASVVGGNGCGGCSSCWLKVKNIRRKKDRVRFVCASSFSSSSSYSVMDHYKTLRIQPGASETEVKKAFRKLALQYHPDVCRGSNCGVQFNRINEAYDIVMSGLRRVEDGSDNYGSHGAYDEGIDEPMRGMDDPDWDLWEEWMGWEGAGIRDYSSHINPYI